MKKRIDIETSYSELSTEKFCRLAAAIFDNRTNPLDELRLKILEVLSGIPISAKSSKCSQYIAELTAFAFSVRHNHELFHFFSEDTVKILTYCMPQEINDNKAFEEIEPVLNQLQSSIDINFSIKKNILSDLTINNKLFKGPVFDVNENGIISTDIKAGQWIDACEYMDVYISTGNFDYLLNVASCFYLLEGQPYNTTAAQLRAKMFKNVPQNRIKAIWFLTKYMQKTLLSIPSFSVLFSEKKVSQDSGRINVGPSEILYQLSKEGYGSLSEIFNLPILDFFNIQVRNMKEAVLSLRKLKKSNPEIAEALKMDIETVLKF